MTADLRPASGPAVDFRNISYTYEGEDTPVLNDISLQVEDGEFVLILGPSGCGKSTFLQVHLQRHNSPYAERRLERRSRDLRAVPRDHQGRGFRNGRGNGVSRSGRADHLHAGARRGLLRTRKPLPAGGGNSRSAGGSASAGGTETALAIVLCSTCRAAKSNGSASLRFWPCARAFSCLTSRPRESGPGRHGGGVHPFAEHARGRRDDRLGRAP